MSAKELKALREFLTSKPKPVNPTPELLRARLAKLADILPKPKDQVVESVVADSVAGEFIMAPGADVSRCVYYLHGGGYAIGSVATHRTLCHNLSHAAGTRVLSMDYALAPEYPFPSGLEDAIVGYRWLLEQGTAPDKIVIAGDSAGGGLAVATLMALRDRGVPFPAAAICFSPWVDMEGTGETMLTRADVDPMVQKDGLLWYANLYLDGVDPRNPLASPLHGDLSGLPPILIQVGDAETLLDDSVRLADGPRVHVAVLQW